MDDLGELVEEMDDVATKYKSIGIALRIKHSELNIIERKHRYDPKAALTSVLEEWLKLNYSAKKGEARKMPSWRRVVEVVDKSSGGNNHALAKKIAASRLISGLYLCLYALKLHNFYFRIIQFKIYNLHSVALEKVIPMMCLD